MKTTLKFYILILFLAFAGSCTDLEEDPIGLLAPEGYFKSAENLQAAINGCYGSMASSNYYGISYTRLLQLSSDMIDIGLDFASGYNDYNQFFATPTNNYAINIWKACYGVMGIANTAIEGVSKIEETQEVKNRLEAEARFIRALVYYDLVRLYGEIPYLDNLRYAVSEVKKSSVDDIYAGIIKDLEFAKEYLPMQHPDNDCRTRPSKGTAVTVLSSVYLTLGNWQQAYDNAKWVIDNAASLNYALENDFQDLFRSDKQDYSKEVIFAVDFLGNKRGDNSVNSFTLENDHDIGAVNGVEGAKAPYTGWSMLVPSLKVYQAWDSRDYRKKVSFTDTILYSDGMRDYTRFQYIQRPHAAKFDRFSGVRKSSTAGWRSDMNYTLFRYAEVLLIAAEAGNEIGKTAEGIGYVNQVRARARKGGVINFAGSGYGTYAPSPIPADAPTGIGKDDFRNLVLEERRLELAFEFKRWYDIKRRDLGNQVFSASGLEPQPNFNKDKHYLIPIPQTEIDMCPNLKPQNPGY